MDIRLCQGSRGAWNHHAWDTETGKTIEDIDLPRGPHLRKTCPKHVEDSKIQMILKKYKLHWDNGEIEDVEGTDIYDALELADYDIEAMNKLDFYEFCEK